MEKFFRKILVFLLVFVTLVVFAGCKNNRRMAELEKKVVKHEDVTELKTLPKFLDDKKDHIVSYTASNTEVFKIGNEQNGEYQVEVKRQLKDVTFEIVVKIIVEGNKEFTFVRYNTKVRKIEVSPTPDNPTEKKKISDIKNLAANASVLFDAVITEISAKDVFAQDETGGVHLRVKNFADFKKGDKITVEGKVNGGFTDFTVGNAEDNNPKITKNGEGTLPEAINFTGDVNFGEKILLLTNVKDVSLVKDGENLKFIKNSEDTIRRYYAKVGELEIFLSLRGEASKWGDDHIVKLLENHKDLKFELKNVVPFITKVNATITNAKSFYLTDVSQFVRTDFVEVVFEHHYEGIAEPVVKKQTLELNANVTIEVLAKEGFVFDSENANNLLSAKVAKDLVLKRFYKKQVFEINVHLNGGTPTGVYPVNIEYGKTLNEADFVVTHTSKDFGGWFTTEALTERFDFTKPVKNIVNLYAKWIEKEDPVTDKLAELFTTLNNDKASIEKAGVLELNLSTPKQLKFATLSSEALLKSFVYLNGTDGEYSNEIKALLLSVRKNDDLYLKAGTEYKKVNTLIDKEILNLYFLKVVELNPTLSINSKMADFNGKEVEVVLYAKTSAGYFKEGTLSVSFVRGWDPEFAAKARLDELFGFTTEFENLKEQDKVLTTLNKTDYEITLEVNPYLFDYKASEFFCVNETEYKAHINSLVEKIKTLANTKLGIGEEVHSVDTLSASTLLKALAKLVKAQIPLLSGINDRDLLFTKLSGNSFDIKLFATTSYGEEQSETLKVKVVLTEDSLAPLFTEVFDKLNEDFKVSKACYLTFDRENRSIYINSLLPTVKFSDWLKEPLDPKVTAFFSALAVNDNELDLKTAEKIIQKFKELLVEKGLTLDSFIHTLDEIKIPYQKTNPKGFVETHFITISGKEAFVKVVFGEHTELKELNDFVVKVGEDYFVTTGEKIKVKVTLLDGFRVSVLSVSETEVLVEHPDVNVPTSEVEVVINKTGEIKILQQEILVTLNLGNQYSVTNPIVKKWFSQDKKLKTEELKPSYENQEDKGVIFDHFTDDSTGANFVEDTLLTAPVKLTAHYAPIPQLGNCFNFADGTEVFGRGVVIDMIRYKSKNNKNKLDVYIASENGGILIHYATDEQIAEATYSVLDDVVIRGTYGKQYQNCAYPVTVTKIASGASLPTSVSVSNTEEAQQNFYRIAHNDEVVVVDKPDTEVGKRANLTLKINGSNFKMTYNSLTSEQKAQIDSLVLNAKYKLTNVIASVYLNDGQFVGNVNTNWERLTISDEEKLETTKGEISFAPEYYQGNTIKLPNKGKLYPEVVITYEFIPNSDNLTISGEEATVNPLTGDVPLEIKVTFKIGEKTVIQSYNVTLKQGTQPESVVFQTSDLAPTTLGNLGGGTYAGFDKGFNKDGKNFKIKSKHGRSDGADNCVITGTKNDDKQDYFEFDLSEASGPLSELKIKIKIWNEKEKKNMESVKLLYWDETTSEYKELEDITSKIKPEKTDFTFDLKGKNTKKVKLEVKSNKKAHCRICLYDFQFKGLL